MRERIWYAPYTLKALAGLGARAKTTERVGALLRVETDDGYGFSDLHPWPELGDHPLERQLEWLRTSSKTTLQTQRSMSLTQLDRQSRMRGTSAFSGLEIPPSHLLVSDVSALDAQALEQAQRSGFKAVKIKISQKFESEFEVLKRFANDLRKFRLRFDFNTAFEPDSARAVLKHLSDLFADSIDFVEDPCAFAADTWSELSKAAPLAFDRPLPTSLDAYKVSAAQMVASGVRTLIVKPAVQDPTERLRFANSVQARVVVTSYLDHPVGIMGAALEAARLGRNHGETAGLLSQTAYEPNEFTEAMRTSGPSLKPSDEAGIGFTDLLEKQDWKQLR